MPPNPPSKTVSPCGLGTAFLASLVGKFHASLRLSESPSSDRSACEEALHYLRLREGETHQQLGEACGIDLCVLCLVESHLLVAVEETEELKRQVRELEVLLAPEERE